jgi:kynurenine formamidase
LTDPSPEQLLAALRIPRRGEVIQLALPLYPGAPTVSAHPWQQSLITDGAGSDQAERSENRETYLEELVGGSLHSGCHIDALGHCGVDGRFHGGLGLEELAAPKGLRRFGIEEAGPWVARGVCLDVAAVVGVEHLEAGFAIAPEHLEAACRHHGVSVEPGDVVLLHTGWARFYASEPNRYIEKEPGAGIDAARWLTDRHVSLVGADNWGFEAVPAEQEGHSFPVHQHLLTETGTHILENVDTTPLLHAEAAEFLFLASVPPIIGATAAPLNPLAVL